MFSKYSIGLIILGSLLLMLNRVMSGYSEPLALAGLLLLFASAAAVFIAAFKKEPGQLKVWSLSIFFVILFVITWAEPFEILRLMTWLKNIL
ncbi:hypothetical protein KQ939_07840 [Planococcus sp. CP5-4]|uniref:hypothetical protein n=1 Tax=unclassified Planococcus (in: firmicutes) TaxID=2662419 RepID=UPI001C234CFD|nr:MULTISPECIES: hypothetical protein [unclassified Planococcus (in: firmicutes)]MBU9671811.1 hypothetical protein [Planococcus sp. CP5-4_YE]MBV0909131.1 hypothetical protein [Planococcus sp. CP5-4_UN]MBW6063623.1 hypothetical protein [Planococcus sp. CP5-4]